MTPVNAPKQNVPVRALRRLTIGLELGGYMIIGSTIVVVWTTGRRINGA